MAKTDAREEVGGKVEAKAIHVTNDTEASRRYGRLKKSKMIPGIVVSFDHSARRVDGS
jgi:hypothetical protein